jgi:uncharacterized protein YeeX (DUF496 family)
MSYEVLRIDLVHHNTQKVRLERLSVGKKIALNEKVLYVHMLKELSKGQMNVSMIKAVIDAFKWEDE